MLAISIFIYFMRINISYNKFINTIASTTLGVYLIHDNPNFRNVSAILIFSICTVIELIRKKYLIK